jgi:hypothetical protein
VDTSLLGDMQQRDNITQKQNSEGQRKRNSGKNAIRWTWAKQRASEKAVMVDFLLEAIIAFFSPVWVGLYELRCTVVSEAVNVRVWLIVVWSKCVFVYILFFHVKRCVKQKPGYSAKKGLKKRGVENIPHSSSPAYIDPLKSSFS